MSSFYSCTTISDGQSFAVFYDELDHAYRQARGADVPDWGPLPLQYADYAVWQRNWLASDAGAAARTYWQTQWPAMYRRCCCRSTII